MAVLADLLVRFGADSAELRKTLKTVESDLGRFTKDVKGMKNALAGAFTAVGIGALASGFAQLVRGGAQAADKIGEMSERVGVSSEDLSRLGYAAQLSGSDIDGLATGLRGLSKQMAEAGAGTGASAGAFRAIGVSVAEANGNLRPMRDVLLDVADKFAGMEDGAGKAALAQQLFGKSGMDLIPLLNRGSDGIRALGAEADAFGVTVSTSAAQSAGRFNDSLDRLAATKEGLARLTAERLTPMIEGLATELTTAAGASGAMKEAADVLAAGVKVLAHVGVTTAAVFNVLGKVVGATAAALAAAAQGNFQEARDAIRAGGADIVDSISETGDRLRAIWLSEAGEVAATAPATGKKIAAPLTKGIEELGRERDRAEKTLDGILAGLDAKLAGGQSDWDAMHFRLFSGDLADEVKRMGLAGRLMAAQILAQVAALEKLDGEQEAVAESMAQFNALVSAHGALWDATRTPLERYTETVRELDGLLAQGAIDADLYARGLASAQAALGDAPTKTRAMVDAVVGGFSQMITATGSLEDRIRGFFDGILASFMSMIEQMVARWLTAQILMAPLGAAGGGAGGVASAPNMVGIFADTGPSFAVPGVASKSVALASSGAGTEVNLHVTTLDAASFDRYLADNEGVLADRINRLASRGRV